MSIPTSRASGPADVVIDSQTCSVCGACVEVCKGNPLYIAEGVVRVDQTRLFGCIGCGQCMAVCPTGSIQVTGRDLSPADLLDLPRADERLSYEALYGLLKSRRSVREFRDQEVPRPVVEQILDAAATAPMGLPPSDVGVLVFAGRPQIRALRQALMEQIRKVRWLFSPAALAVMRPFIGRENYALFKSFIGPAFAAYDEAEGRGKDWFLYDAPLGLYFYGSPYSDPGDALIAATLAMIAAQSLGLGTCMLGFPGYVFQYSAAVRKRYGLPRKIQAGILLAIGYPRYTYRRGVRRRFASVRWVPRAVPEAEPAPQRLSEPETT